MSQPDFPDQNFPVPSSAAGSQALQSERMILVREANPANNLRDYLSILFKHKIGIIVSFLAISLVGIALIFVYRTWIYSPRFEATSSILVKFGWENYSPDLSGSPDRKPIPSQSQNAILSSEVSILQSDELKTKVISSLKPENIFPQLARQHYRGLSNNDAALVLLSKYLTVTPSRTGNVIDVAFDGSTPAGAAAVVNQLVKFYIDKRAEIYKDPKSVLFLQRKVDEYRQRLAESEDRLKAFREETKIISFDEQRTMLLKGRSDMVAALNGAASGIKEAQGKIAELQKELNSLPKTTVTAAASDRMGTAESKLLALELQEKDLVSKYKGDNPLIVNVRGQIAMVKEYLKKNAADKAKTSVAPPNPVYQDVQKQILDNKALLSALKVRYADTEKQLGVLSTEIQRFDANANQLTQLKRAVSSNEGQYNDFRQKLRQAQVYDELDRDKISSVSVIAPAVAPVVPVNPMKPLYVLIPVVILVAILGSFAIAYMREVGKQVMSTAMEAERRLDLPVLVTIPVKN